MGRLETVDGILDIVWWPGWTATSTFGGIMAAPDSQDMGVVLLHTDGHNLQGDVTDEANLS
jgi:hypothetical protein